MSFAVPIVLPFGAAGVIVGYALVQSVYTLYSFCSLVFFSLKIFICMIGFILYCVVACWYKRREKDDGFFPQSIFEEVYDRYLTAAT